MHQNKAKLIILAALQGCQPDPAVPRAHVTRRVQPRRLHVLPHLAGGSRQGNSPFILKLKHVQMSFMLKQKKNTYVRFVLTPLFI